MTILVVDDVYELAKLLETMLQQLGFEVMVGRNGVEGAQLLQDAERPPILIISNYVMPKMNGMAFLNYVRSEAAWNDIPFVLFTAHSSDKLMTDAFDSGANAMLPKPFNMADLKSVLNYLHISPQ